MGLLGDIEVEDAPAVVGEHDEDEQDAQTGGGNCEEVDRDEVANMVGEERAPSLRGGWAALRHEPGDGTLGHVDAKLQELTMDSRGAPERVRSGHSYDKALDLSIDRRAAHGGPARELGPVLTEAPPPPAQNGLGGNDHERLSPPGPDPGQRHPEEPISGA